VAPLTAPRPLISLRFEFVDGSTIERVYTMEDVTDAPDAAWFDDPPPWLSELHKTWERPQDPVAFTAKVAPGHEDDARQVLAMESVE
jgi:hypothetical protein